MSIYYETLCPDSLHFFQNQLIPLLENKKQKILSDQNVDFVNQKNGSTDMDSLLDIELIPYGKAVVCICIR